MTSQGADAPAVSPEEYREFIQGIELKQVYLGDARVKRLRSPNPDKRLSFGQSSGKRKFTNIEGGFFATFNLQITLLEEDDEKPIGEINVTYIGEYKSEKKITKKIFEIFEELNLPLNLYPYVREYVHTTTNRMGMPALILATFKN